MAKLSGYQIFRYPRERIDETDDYLKIDIVNYRPPGLGAKDSFRLKSSEESINVTQPVATIVLPMPQDISDSRGVEWGEDRMNSLAAAAAGGAANAIGAGSNVLSALGQSVITGLNNIKDVAQSGNAQDAVSSYFGTAAINALSGQENIDPFAALTRSTGSVLNQNQELLFRGVTLRSHSFNWTFTPRFKEEADQVKAIIRVLKSSMSAKKQGAVADGGKGVFIQSPDVYQLGYYSGGKKHPFLNAFKVCALQSCNVSYTAAGTYATYGDSTPVQISMNLSFQELTPIYAEDYQRTEAGDGVGY